MTIDLLKSAHEQHAHIGEHIILTTTDDSNRVTLSIWFDKPDAVTSTPDKAA